MEDIKAIRRIGWYCTEFNSARGIFFEWSSNIVTKKYIARASSDYGMSLFSAMEVELMHRGFEVMPGWAGASALPKQVLTQLNALSSFHTEILLKLFCFVQSIHTSREALRVDE